MLSDCMSTEMQEGSEVVSGYFVGCRCLELVRDAIGFFVVIVPAVIDQLFQRTWSSIIDHLSDSIELRRLAVIAAPILVGCFEQGDSGIGGTACGMRAAA